MGNIPENIRKILSEFSDMGRRCTVEISDGQFLLIALKIGGVRWQWPLVKNMRKKHQVTLNLFSYYPDERR